MEREVLWAIAPHIIWPLRFVLPHHKGLRPAWLLRLGTVPLRPHRRPQRCCRRRARSTCGPMPPARPLKPLFSKAFEYSDCWVDDARLVVLNARDAADRGATIRTRTRVVSARRRRGRLERGRRGHADRSARGRPGEARSSTRPGRGSTRCFPTSLRPQRRSQRAPRQGQPHRRAAASSTIRAPISSRTPTGASSSPFPTRTSSR